MTVPAAPLVSMRRSLSGSMIGGIAETQEMLDFCAEHGVRPEIEVITPDYINEAYERVLASDVRYRFVIDTASLRDATDSALVDAVQRPPGRGELRGDALHVLGAGVVMCDVLDERRDLVLVDFSVGDGRRSSRR